MARIPMVTRTIKSTKAQIKVANLATDEMTTVEVVLPRTYKDNDAIKKAAEKLNNDENIKILRVLSSEVTEHLYGCTEAEFLTFAHIIAKGLAEETATPDAQ